MVQNYSEAQQTSVGTHNPLAHTLHYNTTILQHIKLHYTTLHYNTLHYIKILHIKLHYITLHYNTLHYITIHYTTLHYTTLDSKHFTSLHCTHNIPLERTLDLTMLGQVVSGQYYVPQMLRKPDRQHNICFLFKQ